MASSVVFVAGAVVGGCASLLYHFSGGRRDNDTYKQRLRQERVDEMKEKVMRAFQKNYAEKIDEFSVDIQSFDADENRRGSTLNDLTDELESISSDWRKELLPVDVGKGVQVHVKHRIETEYGQFSPNYSVSSYVDFKVSRHNKV
jgi:gas vesicle protein